MAHAGQILENPVSGEKIIFRQTAAETDGELLAFELVLAPGGAVPGAHVHPEHRAADDLEALLLERLFETVVSLAEEGRCLRSGMPKPLDLALFVREFRREVRALPAAARGPRRARAACLGGRAPRPRPAAGRADAVVRLSDLSAIS
jgi:hypothetical protein